MNNKFSDNQVERLLDLVPYLTANPGVALDKIASDFHVTKNAILDDLNTLWMCGLPGYTPLELIDLSFDTGFVTIRNAEILSKPRRLSTAEIAAVILGLSMLRESVLQSNENHVAISDLISKLSISFKIPIPDSVDELSLTQVNKTLLEAIKSKSNILIEYFSFAKDRVDHRTISPLRVRMIDNQEYLDAYCRTSEDFRSFRIDRIKNCEIRDVQQDAPFELVDRTEPGIDFDIAITSQPRKVLEFFNIPLSNGDSKIVEFSNHAFNLDWIIRSVFSLNASAILTKPSAIREQIAIRAEKALKLYI